MAGRRGFGDAGPVREADRAAMGELRDGAVLPAGERVRGVHLCALLPHHLYVHVQPRGEYTFTMVHAFPLFFLCFVCAVQPPLSLISPLFNLLFHSVLFLNLLYLFSSPLDVLFSGSFLLFPLAISAVHLPYFMPFPFPFLPVCLVFSGILSPLPYFFFLISHFLSLFLSFSHLSII